MSQIEPDNESQENERRRRAEERRLRRESAERRISESQRLLETGRERTPTLREAFQNLKEIRREGRAQNAEISARLRSSRQEDESEETQEGQASNENRGPIEDQTRPVNELGGEERGSDTSRANVGIEEEHVGSVHHSAPRSGRARNGNTRRSTFASRIFMAIFGYPEESFDRWEAIKLFWHLTIFLHVNSWFLDRYFWTDKNSDPPLVLDIFYYLKFVTCVPAFLLSNFSAEKLRIINVKVFRFRMFCRQYCPRAIRNASTTIIFIYCYIFFNLLLDCWLDILVAIIKASASIWMSDAG